MDYLHKYRIAYQGLTDGLHEFDFEIDDTFFENLDYSEIKKGSLLAHVILNKKSHMLEFAFKINGLVELTCDRCLEDFNLPIDYNGKLFVKFSSSEEELDDDVICISPDENEINIAHYLYESISLSIPLKRVHPSDKKGKPLCNSEMLKKIKEYQINAPTEEDVDPRWDELKKLMENNNN
ncbi:MAG: hypothetical protein A2W99_17255 [Bacteroidetes bacterium GWF2_33_16]|nr:MAG: hypothetical protein A2X00_13540 [Bacteroidetes bacterium GWE2_32_14]OFY03495.1 MAG: hypothetical protein A2W99_17255 [Bacteroidetes bacterium GWF2_33_16]